MLLATLECSFHHTKPVNRRVSGEKTTLEGSSGPTRPQYQLRRHLFHHCHQHINFDLNVVVFRYLYTALIVSTGMPSPYGPLSGRNLKSIPYSTRQTVRHPTQPNVSAAAEPIILQSSYEIFLPPRVQYLGIKVRDLRTLDCLFMTKLSNYYTTLQKLFHTKTPTEGRVPPCLILRSKSSWSSRWPHRRSNISTREQSSIRCKLKS